MSILPLFEIFQISTNKTKHNLLLMFFAHDVLCSEVVAGGADTQLRVQKYIKSLKQQNFLAFFGKYRHENVRKRSFGGLRLTALKHKKGRFSKVI